MVSGVGAKSSGLWTSPLAPGRGRPAPGPWSGRRSAGSRLGPLPVGDVVEEGEHRPDLVRVGLGDRVSGPPGEGGRALQPPGGRPGLVAARRWPHRSPARPWSARSATTGPWGARGPRGTNGHSPSAVLAEDQPVAGRRHHRVVHGPDLVQHPEGHLDRLGLAARPSQVGLQRVAEPAVGVLVGGQRAAIPAPGPPHEQVGEPVPVDQPRRSATRPRPRHPSGRSWRILLLQYGARCPPPWCLVAGRLSWRKRSSGPAGISGRRGRRRSGRPGGRTRPSCGPGRRSRPGRLRSLGQAPARGVPVSRRAAAGTAAPGPGEAVADAVQEPSARWRSPARRPGRGDRPGRRPPGPAPARRRPPRGAVRAGRRRRRGRSRSATDGLQPGRRGPPHRPARQLAAGPPPQGVGPDPIVAQVRGRRAEQGRGRARVEAHPDGDRARQPRDRPGPGVGAGQVELGSGGDQVHEPVGDDPARAALTLNGQLPEAAHPGGQDAGERPAHGR